jgi:NADH:ubiquinone oxidoreductase subunit 5 (subunit L)/multisubunit Na+/H+ antiporter MnhA subunit
MKHDSRFARFFAYLSLFCFSMLGLLISQNILFLFIFWELVGLCSYLLIGFWFEKKSASNAAIKAFVANRVGDFGFLIGLMLCFTYLGTLDLDAAGARFEAATQHAGVSYGERSPAALAVPVEIGKQASTLFSVEFLGLSLATWMGIGLFCGAIGKSAQFPLQVWLPDAMEGPTPVSALIHAATMVAAGVYLVGRIYTLLTPDALLFIAIIGCVTLTMAALIAIVQTDIKRVLAFSTLSQLGYMIFAMGIGAWTAALFHLLTHAFFKALLFLGSGQVIEGCHHEQDMSRMGGLFRKMPVTATTFLIAVLAISGVGIPLTQIGIGGFYSKDEILAVGYYRHFGWGHAGEAHASSLRANGSSDPSRAAQYSSHDPRHPSRDRKGAVAPIGAAVLASWQQDRAEAPRQLETAAHDSAQEHGGAPAHAESAAHSAAAAAPGDDEHHGRDYAGEYPRVTTLPGILFFLPILVAYITPFYMGRCFMLTFMGKPRDQHIHDHAHESPVMYLPLVALAIMTLISGPLFFREFVGATAPASPALVPAIDGHLFAGNHAAHQALALIVGPAFVVGLLLSFAVYRNGFAIAARVKALPVMGALHNLLWNKFYFDQVYNALLVMGTRGLAVVCALFDAWIIDGLVNLAGYLTRAIGLFTGVVLDNRGVDGAVNGTGRLAWALGGMFRGTHTGVIRNYILMTAMVVAGVIVWSWSPSLAVLFVILGACVIAAPALCYNVVAPLLAAAVVMRVGRIVVVGFGRTGDAGAWNWDALTNFWPAYFTSPAGYAELAILLILYGVLMIRYRGLTPPEPAYAVAPVSNR